MYLLNAAVFCYFKLFLFLICCCKNKEHMGKANAGFYGQARAKSIDLVYWKWSLGAGSEAIDAHLSTWMNAMLQHCSALITKRSIYLERSMSG